MKPHPPLPAVSPAGLRGSSAWRPRWHASAVLCLTTSVEPFSDAPAARRCCNPCGTTRRDSAGDRGTRNRLSDLPATVHVDQLRRRTPPTTASLVTRRFRSFVAPDDSFQAGSRESRLTGSPGCRPSAAVAGDRGGAGLSGRPGQHCHRVDPAVTVAWRLPFLVVVASPQAPWIARGMAQGRLAWGPRRQRQRSCTSRRTRRMHGHAAPCH